MLASFVYAYSVYYKTTSVKVANHNHPTYELIYYAKGVGELNASGKSYAYSPDCFAIIKPDVVHNEIHYKPTIAICLGYIAENQEAEFDNEITILRNSHISNIPSYLQMIMEEQAHKQKTSAELTQSLTDTIVILLNRMLHGTLYAIPRPVDTMNTISEAWDMNSDADLASIWDTLIAEYKNYSYDRFRHIFKEQMHLSPAQFRTHLRLQKAIYLLVNTAMSITDIASVSGFSSCSYFTQQFCKEIGFTPSQYRTKLSHSPTSLITWMRNDTTES